MADKIYTERWLMSDTRKAKAEAVHYSELAGLSLTAFIRMAIREKISRAKKMSKR